MLVAVSYNAATWLVLDGGSGLGLVADRSFSVFAGVTFSLARL